MGVPFWLRSGQTLRNANGVAEHPANPHLRIEMWDTTIRGWDVGFFPTHAFGMDRAPRLAVALWAKYGVLPK